MLNAFRVVEQLSLDRGAGVSHIARELGMAKSTAQRALLTLREAGWARQDSLSRWVLTLRCAVVARRVVHEGAIAELVHPIVLDLRDRTHETVRCFIVEGTNLVLLDTVETDHAVRAVETELAGVPLHATAIGKAALAALPEEAVEAYVDGPLAGVTRKTITDANALRQDLEDSRRRGWTRITEELYPDVGGVAAVAPVSSDVMVGIGISYPLHRAPEETTAEFGRLTRDTAGQLAARLAPFVASS